MLTKCCSDSCVCLWGMDKFTACLNNMVKWKESKQKRRPEETGKKRRDKMRQKEGGRKEGKLKNHSQWGGETIHSGQNTQNKIIDESAALFYKHFITSRKRKRPIFLPKIWGCFFPFTWFEVSNRQYLHSNLSQAFLKIKVEHKSFVLINSNSLWN